MVMSGSCPDYEIITGGDEGYTFVSVPFGATPLDVAVFQRDGRWVDVSETILEYSHIPTPEVNNVKLNAEKGPICKIYSDMLYFDQKQEQKQLLQNRWHVIVLGSFSNDYSIGVNGNISFAQQPTFLATSPIRGAVGEVFGARVSVSRWIMKHSDLPPTTENIDEAIICNHMYFTDNDYESFGYAQLRCPLESQRPYNAERFSYCTSTWRIRQRNQLDLNTYSQRHPLIIVFLYFLGWAQKSRNLQEF